MAQLTAYYTYNCSHCNRRESVAAVVSGPTFASSLTGARVKCPGRPEGWWRIFGEDYCPRCGGELSAALLTPMARLKVWRSRVLAVLVLCVCAGTMRGQSLKLRIDVCALRAQKAALRREIKELRRRTKTYTCKWHPTKCKAVR